MVLFLNSEQVLVHVIHVIHVYCIHGNNGLENSYQPIQSFVCNIEALIPRTLPSGFVLLYCLQTSGVG